MTFQLGADRLVGRPGDTLFVVRGVHHTLANLSGSPARYLLVCTPGGFEQRFGPEAESTPSGPNTDVIVVGTRGLGSFRGALMGSVSTAVVHQADRPVLVARDDAEARASSAA